MELFMEISLKSDIKFIFPLIKSNQPHSEIKLLNSL